MCFVVVSACKAQAQWLNLRHEMGSVLLKHMISGIRLTLLGRNWISVLEDEWRPKGYHSTNGQTNPIVRSATRFYNDSEEVR